MGQLNKLVNQNFQSMGDGLGSAKTVEHVIRTDSAPIKQRYYPVSPVLQSHIDKELDEMLRNDVVEPSCSASSSPILLVKKDGGFRFSVNYRKFNAVTARDSYPLP